MKQADSQCAHLGQSLWNSQDTSPHGPSSLRWEGQRPEAPVAETTRPGPRVRERTAGSPGPSAGHPAPHRKRTAPHISNHVTKRPIWGFKGDSLRRGREENNTKGERS